MSLSSWLVRLDSLLKRVEDGLLAILLLTMITLASTQIFLRNVADFGFSWADPLLRILVLWLGLMGAVAASRTNQHIKIDLLSKYLPPKVQLWAQTISHLSTAIVCGVITWHAGRFIHDEITFAAPGLWGFSIWIFEIIIPVAFGLLTLRYGLFSLKDTRQLFITSPLT